MSDRIDELVDTPEQALRFLDTVMYSDNEDMRRGAFNRVSIHIQQAATIAREEWKKPRSCPSCGEYMVHIDTAEIVQQETAEYVLRAREAEAQVSEIQSATKNDATRIITEHVPWRSNDTHPRRVALAFIKQLEAKVSSLHDECDRLDAQLVASDTAAIAYDKALRWLAHEMYLKGMGSDWYESAMKRFEV